MVNLKEYAAIGLDKARAERNFESFRTIGFDPNEMLQLKEMNKKELTGLMVFCGIHVYNGVPLVVMEEDEMRMAYLVWRAARVQEKKDQIKPKLERGMKWINYIQQAVEIVVNR